MKRFYILLLPLLLGLGCIESTPTTITLEEDTTAAAKKGQNKVDVCHRGGNGTYKLINIAEPALPAHLNHGDGRPGDPVPGMEGFVFDDSCEPVIAIPTNGLVAYYPFNENANDESGNGHDGFVNNASLTTDRFGNANSAYSFDGVTSYIAVPHDDDFNFSTAFTLAAFVKQPVYNEGGIVVRWETGPDEAKSFEFVLNNDGTLSIFMRTDVMGDIVLGPSNQQIPLDAFVHVAVVYDGTELRTYIDGNLEQSMPVSGDVPDHSQPTVMGGSGATNGGIASDFTGTLDEVRIYNLALTDDEIQILSNL